MATVYTFSPSPQAPFQFQPTLDGAVYSVTIPWNIAGQRWYVQITDLQGNLVVNLPLIGSPAPVNLQGLYWQNGRAYAVTVAPHGYRVASTVTLSVVDCVPAAYNGIVQAMATSPNTLSWLLNADPGASTVLGSLSYEINLLGGYFASRMVFRQSSQQFEISP